MFTPLVQIPSSAKSNRTAGKKKAIAAGALLEDILYQTGLWIRQNLEDFTFCNKKKKLQIFKSEASAIDLSLL